MIRVMTNSQIFSIRDVKLSCDLATQLFAIWITLFGGTCLAQSAKGITVGLPAIIYGLESNFDLGITAYTFRKALYYSDQSISVSPQNQSTKVDLKHFQADFFFRYFPSKSSSFFVGIALGTQDTEYKFTMPLEDNAEAGAEVRYLISAKTLSNPIGWMFAFKSGLVLSIDLAFYKYRLSDDRAFLESGDDAGVDERERRSFVENIDIFENYRLLWPGPSTMLGWRF